MAIFGGGSEAKNLSVDSFSGLKNIFVAIFNFNLVLQRHDGAISTSYINKLQVEVEDRFQK